MKNRLKDIDVLVVGDFMADEYIIGLSNKNSPEAPVPIVVPEREYIVPGGAGNVAINLKKLGANVSCSGNVGDDIYGYKLIEILENEGINCNKIEVLKRHETTLKKRIYSNGKQIIRIDREKILEWEPAKLNFEKYDIVILSDYNKGVLLSNWFDILEAELIVADPKKKNFSFYKNANIITPNLNELNSALNIEKERNQDINEYCKSLVNNHNLEYLISKRGENGIHVFGNNEFSYQVKAHKINSPDVSGAGDTVISIISLFYFLTKDIIFSTNIANYGASLVVSKEVLHMLSIMSWKILYQIILLKHITKKLGFNNITNYMLNHKM